jgi:hypothetical protein
MVPRASCVAELSGSELGRVNRNIDDTIGNIATRLSEYCNSCDLPVKK